MSSSDVVVRKFLSCADVIMADFDPNATTAVAITDPRTASLWFDLRNFGGMVLGLMRTIGTGDISSIIFQASKVAAGTSPQTVKTITFTVDPDAVGDYAFWEISAQDIVQAIADLGLNGAGGVNEYRYVAPVIALATSTDEFAGLVILTQPDHAGSGLSPSNIA